MSNEKQKSWKHGVAGCTAGLASVLILHPLDVIKTRLQVQDGVQGILPAYRGTVHALKSILADEGWRSLYNGLTPALIGAGVSWGLYFAAYNQAKVRWQRVGGHGQLSPVQHLLAAAEGGAVVCLITNPIWVVKTRLQLQRGSALKAAGVARAGASAGASKVQVPMVQYTGFMDGVRRITQEEGVRGLYRGLGPSLLMVSHGAIQFMVYEELKRQLSAGSSPNETRVLTAVEITLVGAASKLFATISTYPFSVIRARLQQRQQAGRAVFLQQ